MDVSNQVTGSVNKLEYFFFFLAPNIETHLWYQKYSYSLRLIVIQRNIDFFTQLKTLSRENLHYNSFLKLGQIFPNLNSLTKLNSFYNLNIFLINWTVFLQLEKLFKIGTAFSQFEQLFEKNEQFL